MTPKFPFFFDLRPTRNPEVPFNKGFTSYYTLIAKRGRGVVTKNTLPSRENERGQGKRVDEGKDEGVGRYWEGRRKKWREPD